MAECDNTISLRGKIMKTILQELFYGACHSVEFVAYDSRYVGLKTKYLLLLYHLCVFMLLAVCA